MIQFNKQPYNLLSTDLNDFSIYTRSVFLKPCIALLFTDMVELYRNYVHFATLFPYGVTLMDTVGFMLLRLKW